MADSENGESKRLEQQAKRDEIRAKLVSVGDMRPGSLVERYRRCGKKSCHCAQPDAKGHGPSWSLTREVAGTTVTRVVPAAAVAQIRDQLSEFRRFKDLSRELVEVSVQLCEAELDASTATSGEDRKKKASKRRSRARSSPKSEDS